MGALNTSNPTARTLFRSAVAFFKIFERETPRRAFAIFVHKMGNSPDVAGDFRHRSDTALWLYESQKRISAYANYVEESGGLTSGFEPDRQLNWFAFCKGAWRVTNEVTPRLPTATGFAARRAVVALRNHNIDPTPLLERFGLSEQGVNEDQIRVSAAAQARFLEAVAEALHDPALGFHLATEVNPRAVGLLFYVASSAKDLGEAIELFARYLRIVNEAVRVKLTRRNSDLVVELHLVGVPRFRAGHNAEFGIAVIVRGLREITGRNVHPTKITFAHIRSSGFPEFERFCGCPVEFGGSSDELVFSNQSLAAPLITEDTHLLDALRPICEEAAQQRETAPGSVRALVENEVQKLLPHGNAQRHNVAKNLAMSTRTLARRLASEGTTFEEVVDELRRSLALQYVKTQSISLSQIAWLLGYEGGTSFNHAFRRWTGRPPSAARAARLLPAPA